MRGPGSTGLSSVGLILVLLAGATSAAGPTANLLRNPAFELGLDPDGLPLHWAKYGGLGKDQRLSLAQNREDGQHVVLIEDEDAQRPYGISQVVEIDPGKTYTAVARIRAVDGGWPDAGTLLLHFGPGRAQTMCQFGAASIARFTDFSVTGTAPADATHATVYVYSRKRPNCRFLVARVNLTEGEAAAGAQLGAAGAPALGSGGRRAPGLEAQPPPVYTELKPLCLTTWLVHGGTARTAIVVPSSGRYDDLGRRIADVVHKATGVRLPVVADNSEDARIPPQTHVVLLGNRSTNRAVRELYNRHFCLLDLRYPGRGGTVLRTLHNPFGNGCNAILVGGSDLVGVQEAVAQFIRRLEEAAGDAAGDGQGPMQLGIGRLADIRLPEGMDIPDDMAQFPLWSASDGYGDGGFFGWNILSKRAALYYMTGDPFHAREFVRLAFPDAQAKREIRAVDQGKVDITDPLTGLDHYRTHRMILYWDLIEESPVFSAEERLRITNAFARQLKHRRAESVYRYGGPAVKVSSRHGQWGAVCVFRQAHAGAADPHPGDEGTSPPSLRRPELLPQSRRPAAGRTLALLPGPDELDGEG